MENNNTIIFRMGEETGIVIEKTKEQFEHSLFKEQYRQVFDIMDTIIVRSTKTETHKEIDDKMSNIIVFCGDRGEGKTSALETVRGILSNKTILKNAQSEDLFSSESELDTDSFKVLRLVDPAFFDDKHNLLELLIGQMYADIREAEKKNNDDESELDNYDGNLASRNHLIGMFQEVKKSLSIIHKASDKNAYDSLEEVDDLAAGIELKAKFDELMQEYAKFFHKKRVLISIDDLDLNATEGYTMSEEIRKYLSSPTTCVVLMAVKIEQMIEVVQSYLRRKMSKEIIPNDVIKEMAHRYVMKFIPENHRVWMPNGTVILDRQLEIYEENELKEKFDSVKEAVVRLIYRKTRYIFVNTRNISPIVPNNLRELRLLWATLWKLNDGEKNDENHIKNKTIFKQYFYNVWIKCLQKEDIEFVASLINNHDLISLNKSIVAYLTKKYIGIYGLDSKSNTNLLLETIIDPRNTMQNLSTGDVMYVVSTLENLTTDSETQRLLFFIKAFFSITLYESYDIITIDNDHIYATSGENEVSIYKYDSLYRKLNALQRVLNGSYFTYNPEDILPKESSYQRARDIRYYNPKQLKDIYDELIINTPKTLSDYEIKLNTLEFFALTTAYDAYSDDEAKANRRQLSTPYRITNIRPKASKVSFDVLSIFYNIINIKHTYERWNDFYRVDSIEESVLSSLNNKKTEEEQEIADKRNKQKPSLFVLAKDNEFSLYKKMLRECTDYTEMTYTSEHYLESDATIRFIDVQLAIMDLALNNKNVHHVRSNKLNIRLLYNDIKEMGVNLYPLKEGGGRHELKFHFLTPINAYLKEIDETTFDYIFNSDVRNKSSNDELSTLINLLMLFSAKLKFPVEGVKLRRQIRKSYPDFYQACGNAKYWNKVIDKDKTFNAISDIADVLLLNKELRETFVNNMYLISSN